MKKKLRRGFKKILWLVLIGSFLMVLLKIVQYRQGQDAYDTAQQLAGISGENLTDKSNRPDEGSQSDKKTEKGTPDAPKEPEAIENPSQSQPPDNIPRKSEHNRTDRKSDINLDINLAALQEKNSDVIGWIEIPDTQISYPIMQSQDNDFYLKHTWEKEKNSVGSIFMECRCSPDFNDFNTIIYGHRMKNNSMFGSLKYYSSADYWKEHPYINIVDAGGTYQYEIYAAYEVRIDEMTYRIGNWNGQVKQEFIDFGRKKSVIRTDVMPEPDDWILTLSTCTVGNETTRWVVQAVVKNQ